MEAEQQFLGTWHDLTLALTQGTTAYWVKPEIKAKGSALCQELLHTVSLNNNYYAYVCQQTYLYGKLHVVVCVCKRERSRFAASHYMNTCPAQALDTLQYQLSNRLCENKGNFLALLQLSHKHRNHSCPDRSTCFFSPPLLLI